MISECLSANVRAVILLASLNDASDRQEVSILQELGLSRWVPNHKGIGLWEIKSMYHLAHCVLKSPVPMINIVPDVRKRNEIFISQRTFFYGSDLFHT